MIVFLLQMKIIHYLHLETSFVVYVVLMKKVIVNYFVNNMDHLETLQQMDTMHLMM